MPMKTIEGYSKEKYTNTSVLLAGGGAKALSDFIGSLSWDSTNKKIKYTPVGGSATDLVTLSWNNIANKPSTFAPSAHDHTYLKKNFKSTGITNIPFTGEQFEYGILTGAATGVASPEDLKAFDSYSQVEYINLPWYSNLYGGQLMFGANSGKIGYRTIHNGTWTLIKEIIHSDNYTTYTVKKDGTGATGTWGINISGNAGSVAWANITGKPSSFNPSSHSHPYLPTTQVSQEQASNDDWIRTHALSTLRGHVYNTHSLEWQYLFGISSGKTYGSILRTSYGNGTPRIQVMGLTNGTWSSWREVAYDDNTVKKDGTGASGTWGISITGSAGSVAWGNVTGKPSTFEPSSHDHDTLYPKKDGTGASGTWGINITGSAGSSGSAGIANGLASTGYGSSNLTYLQTPDSFFGNSGWCHYIIANHGDGSSYYNFTIGLPFWGVPIYKRLEGGTGDGWHTFITSENIGSQSVSYASSAGSVAWGNVTGKPFNWSGQSGQPTWLWGSNDGTNYYVWNPSNFSVNYANRAAYLDGHGVNPDNSHPGYGARVFYSWNTGSVGNSSSGWCTGITIGAHPSDQGYGFQIVQNLWDDRTYTRRYNGGWQEWKTLAWTSDIPTVGNGTVTVTQAGNSIGSFTMNQSGNTLIDLNDTNYYPIRSYTSGLKISSYSGSTNCELYVPNANGTSQAGVVSTEAQTFGGEKTFASIRLRSTSNINYGGYLYFGDGSYVYLSELEDDQLTLNASKIFLGISGTQKYYIDGTVFRPVTTNSTSNSGIALGNTSYRFTCGYFSNSVYAYEGFYESSDERLKKILNPVKINLDDLAKLRKVYYLWKDKSEDGIQLGMIAQDVQKIYPELVSVDKETGYLSLAYDKLSVIALEAIDTLYEEYKQLKERINGLEKLLHSKEIL